MFTYLPILFLSPLLKSEQTGPRREQLIFKSKKKVLLLHKLILLEQLHEVSMQMLGIFADFLRFYTLLRLRLGSFTLFFGLERDNMARK